MTRIGGPRYEMIPEILFIIFVVGLLSLIILGYRQRMEEDDIRMNDSIDRLNRAIDEYNRKNK